MLYLFLLQILSYTASPATVALINAQSNDNEFATTDWCPTNLGGTCAASNPITRTQDESFTGHWLTNEPYACTHIDYSNGPEQWTAQFADGEKYVT